MLVSQNTILSCRPMLFFFYLNKGFLLIALIHAHSIHGAKFYLLWVQAIIDIFFNVVMKKYLWMVKMLSASFTSIILMEYLTLVSVCNASAVCNISQSWLILRCLSRRKSHYAISPVIQPGYFSCDMPLMVNSLKMKLWGACS